MPNGLILAKNEKKCLFEDKSGEFSRLTQTWIFRFLPDAFFMQNILEKRIEQREIWAETGLILGFVWAFCRNGGRDEPGLGRVWSAWEAFWRDESGDFVLMESCENFQSGFTGNFSRKACSKFFYQRSVENLLEKNGSRMGIVLNIKKTAVLTKSFYRRWSTTIRLPNYLWTLGGIASDEEHYCRR